MSEDVSRQSKDKISQKVGQQVSQEDFKKDVRFEEDKEELGHK